MPFSLKKKKHVDRNDKWYILAKEQGYRSRAAFKLAHINKEFDLIGASTRVILDLCAAPGGWAQVAAKCAGRGAAVIAVDLLPIRPIPNVRTIVGDITMDATHAVVKREARAALAKQAEADEEGRAGRHVDVVLCDGAPNVGAAYNKDAFVQNEIALLSLKCGVECGLKKGGAFVTKVYRGADYNALIWCFGRLFERVRATKPASSRAQSAEIFVVCTGYLAPQRVDPKLLDPKHVFAALGGGLDDRKPLSVLHPKAGGKKKTRQRQGYADGGSDALLVQPRLDARAFLAHDDATQILAERSEITFVDGDAVDAHEKTTAEIRACCADLRVLSKADFRSLLRWRDKLRREDLHLVEGDDDDDDDGDGDDGDGDDGSGSDDGDAADAAGDVDSDDEVLSAIDARRAALAADARREKKRAAKAGAKQRLRAAAGIVEGTNVTLTNDEDVFSLAYATAAGGLGALADRQPEEVEADPATVKGAWGSKQKERYEVYESHADRALAVEDQLDAAYEAFADRRAGKAGMREERHRRAKKLRDTLAAEQVAEDLALVDGDVDGYVRGLEDGASSDESSDEDADMEEDGGEAAPAAVDPRGAAAATRWFANPLMLCDDDDSDDDDDGGAPGEMPKTEREKRKAKRKKATERQERRVRRKQGAEDENDALHVVPGSLGAKKKGDFTKPLTPAQQAKEDAAKKLIKAGLGATKKGESGGLEIAPRTAAAEAEAAEFDPFTNERLQRERTYESDSEDDDERASTLAIATMMLRGSTKKKLVDASYNRFAWNDPKDLPAWFVDDEKRHYRPQVPIKPALLAEMKQRFQSLAAKPIAKVAEARARKKTRADARLKAAKKKAAAVAMDPDMTAGRKLKEVEKAMARGTAKTKRPDKVYVVASKTKSGVRKTAAGAKATKGAKVVKVDRRMKADKRATRAKAKRDKKHGKKRN